jgi:hypothetical protein
MTGLTSIVRGPSVSPALLELEDIAIDLLPRNLFPFIHRFCRGHNLLTLIRAYIIQVVVSPSAYLLAFPRALASETIPLASSLRLTPAPVRLESRGRVTPFLISVWR